MFKYLFTASLITIVALFLALSPQVQNNLQQLFSANYSKNKNAYSAFSTMTSTSVSRHVVEKVLAIEQAEVSTVFALNEGQVLCSPP